MTSHLITPPEIRPYDWDDWELTKTYRRNLPHWEFKGSTYFITICVDRDIVGAPFHDVDLAKLMVENIIRCSQGHYELYAFVVMPDHLHLIIKPINDKSLAKIFQKLKGSSAIRLNRLLTRTGRFWQNENFDHIIRDNKWMKKIWEYVRDNPVKAGLVNNWEDYPYSSFYILKDQMNPS